MSHPFGEFYRAPMRELRLAIHPWLEPLPPRGRSGAAAWLSRPAVVLSILAHVVGAYVITRVSLVGETPRLPPLPSTEFVWWPNVLPPARPSDEPAAAGVEPSVAPPSADPPVQSREPVVPRTVVEVAPLQPVAESPTVVIAEPPPAPRAPGSQFDLEEARRQAAAEVVEQRAREDSFLTFSIDDVAPPRPVAEPKPTRSIFDPGGGTRGPSVGEVGQARTKFGRRVSELCNALTGGFSLMGFGSFCAEPDNEPSGLFPEVRPRIMGLTPECVETRPLAPVADGPATTMKCRLVPKDEIAP